MEENGNNNTIINNKQTPDDRSSGCFLKISKNKFILFGGGNREKTFNDFWELNIILNSDSILIPEWREIVKNNANLDKLTSRFGSIAFNIKIKDSDYLFIHGGQNYLENKHYADMLKIPYIIDENSIDLKLEDIQNSTFYPLNIATTPLERNSHSYSKNKLSPQIIYLFGGGSSKGLLNDLWSFNTTDLKWTNLKLTGVDIPSREMHGMINYTTKNNENNYLYIFGGRLYESIDNKVFRININNNHSEYITTLPYNLCSFAYGSYKHFIIIYGGTDGNTFFNDIIIYNIISNKWAKSKIQINSELINGSTELTAFLGRIGSMMAIDEESETIVIFGGSSIHKDTNYTYIVSIKELIDDNNLVPINL